MPRCRHSWQALYQKPADKHFMSTFTARQLDAYYSCPTCQAVGKSDEQGTILQLHQSKWENQQISAQRWSENLKTFKAAQEEAS